MAPKSKKKPRSSSFEQYGNMTLDELSNLSSANDEEVDEEEAFNSEDEKLYGKFFGASSTKNTHTIVNKNLSLSIPLQHNTVRIVEIAPGSKLTLSSVCLDVSTCKDFDQAKLVYRSNQADDYMCLCNYLSAKKGGMGLMPSTPLTLDVIGPCKLEFKAEVISPGSAKNVDGCINMFGVIVPVAGGGDSTFRYADAFMSDASEEDESIAEEIASNGDAKTNGASLKTTDVSLDKTKKRKHEDEVVEDKPTPKKQQSDAAPEPATENSSEKKLTKKQRKKLAQEKAKQLEETLSAARNDTEATTTVDDDGGNDNDEQEPAKKKPKKKKNKSSDATNSRKSSTRERRLAGGLIISDFLLGDGAPVKPGKKISLHYTGTLKSTGKLFDKNQSKQHPLVFRQGTGEVIRGLERGLEGMKSGGERTIVVPSKLGYGSKGMGEEIPPDSDLVFEVKVLKVG